MNTSKHKTQILAETFAKQGEPTDGLKPTMPVRRGTSMRSTGPISLRVRVW